MYLVRSYLIGEYGSTRKGESGCCKHRRRGGEGLDVLRERRDGSQMIRVLDHARHLSIYKDSPANTMFRLRISAMGELATNLVLS